MATTTDDKVQRACQQHAESLVEQMKGETAPKLTDKRTSALLTLLADSCRQSFNVVLATKSDEEVSEAVIAVVPADEAAQSYRIPKGADPFTWKFFRDNNAAEKKGNKRIRRMKH